MYRECERQSFDFTKILVSESRIPALVIQLKRKRWKLCHENAELTRDSIRWNRRSGNNVGTEKVSLVGRCLLNQHNSYRLKEHSSFQSEEL